MSTKTTTEHMSELDAAHLWHPWSPARADRPIIVSGEGCYVVEAGGRRLLDAKGGVLNASCGYARPEIVAAIAEQANRLMVADLANVGHIPAIRLAKVYAD